MSLNNTLLYSPSKHNLFPIYSPVKLEKAQVFHKNGCAVKIFRDSNFLKNQEIARFFVDLLTMIAAELKNKQN